MFRTTLGLRPSTIYVCRININKKKKKQNKSGIKDHKLAGARGARACAMSFYNQFYETTSRRREPVIPGTLLNRFRAVFCNYVQITIVRANCCTLFAHVM